MGINIEEHIKKARKEGAFDKLPGHGKPLDLKQNAFSDDQQLAFDVLKNAGFLPAWIEERNDIQASFAEAKKRLERAWQRVGIDGRRDRKWVEATAAFRANVAEINTSIRAFNLKAPSVAAHLMLYDAEKEIEQVR